jgi:hypothetical protein
VNFSNLLRFGFSIPILFLADQSAWSMELDWSGQFRTEAHYLRNYSMDSSDIGVIDDPIRTNAGGYYIPGGGASAAQFQTLFLRLNPKLVVNDNIYIKSEWWFGDPVFGFFGDSAPLTKDQSQYYSTQSRGATVSAQRLWADFLTDIGTVQVGRAPLHWGLGVFWNGGEGLWDRYMSTGDVIRLVSKFGAFSVTPSLVKYSGGNNVGGACHVALGGTCNVIVGGGGISDYSLMFKYENADEDFEGGVNFVKRIAGAAQDPGAGFLGIGTVSDTAQKPVGMNFNTWDIFGRKKFGRVSLAGELPIVTGDLGGLDYKTFALAFEANWKITDAWETSLKTGHAPGQANILGNSPSDNRYKAFYFNPGYRLGLLMFNYALEHFAGPNLLNSSLAGREDLQSPFDSSIVNANYINLGGSYQVDKWNFHAAFIYAKALETAKVGENFFNHRERKFLANAANVDQSSSLGWEMDYGTTFQWDDNFQFGADLGWFFPGDFFKFSNTTTDNATSSVFAAVVRAGVAF